VDAERPRVPAQEALDAGLVRSLHAPRGSCCRRRVRSAREIVDNAAPVSVALTRQMMWRMLGADHPMEAHKVDSRSIHARGMSADTREGVTAFLEKRPARFVDRVSHDMPTFFPWWDERRYE
jgi:enoyl-CoA hydratase/carnithine racemase